MRGEWRRLKCRENSEELLSSPVNPETHACHGQMEYAYPSVKNEVILSLLLFEINVTERMTR